VPLASALSFAISRHVPQMSQSNIAHGSLLSRVLQLRFCNQLNRLTWLVVGQISRTEHRPNENCAYGVCSGLRSFRSVVNYHFDSYRNHNFSL
jgi:hypothetical protein